MLSILPFVFSPGSPLCLSFDRPLCVSFQYSTAKRQNQSTRARWAFLELAKTAGEPGRLHLVNGRKEAAREPYRLSRLMWKQLAEKYPGDTEYDYAKLARLDEQMLEALEREIREEQEAATRKQPCRCMRKRFAMENKRRNTKDFSFSPRPILRRFGRFVKKLQILRETPAK